MRNDTVSVVMCTFNGEKYLEEQLDSILNQTYPITELLIQDDGSSDNTIHILSSYQKKYPVIRYTINPTRLGVNENFFSAIRNASGEYVAIADQDDIWLPDKIEKEMETIQDNLLCFCLSRPFSEEKEIWFDPRLENYGLLRTIFVNEIPGHTMLMKKQLIDLMPFNHPMVFYDNWLALTAAAYGKIAFCNEVLCLFRRHNQAASYGEPSRANYTNNISSGIRLFLSAWKKMPRLKQKAHDYFSTLHRFLSQTGVTSGEMSDALYLCRYMSEQNIRNLFRASLLCIHNRDFIFKRKEPNFLKAILRAMLHPVLCYHYIDY